MSRLNPTARRCLVWSTIAAASALTVPAAFAADAAATAAATASAAKPSARPAPSAPAKPREGSLGKGSSSAPLLTRDQLRQCIADNERIKQDTAEIVLAQRAIEKERAEYDRLGVELETEKATLDRTSQAAVDSFNERVRQRTKMLEEYRVAAPAFNARIDKLDAGKLAYAKDCADRRYFEDDFDAIKAGK